MFSVQSYGRSVLDFQHPRSAGPGGEIHQEAITDVEANATAELVGALEIIDGFPGRLRTRLDYDARVTGGRLRRTIFQATIQNARGYEIVVGRIMVLEVTCKVRLFLIRLVNFSKARIYIICIIYF